MIDTSYVLLVLSLIAQIYLVNFEVLYWIFILYSYIKCCDFLTTECFRKFRRFMLTGSKSDLISDKTSFGKLCSALLYLFTSFRLANSLHKNIIIFIVLLLIYVFYRCIYRFSKFEDDDVIIRNHLSIGYGQALCYYENYLKKFLPDGLITRIRNFESYEGVRIPHKLYILVPYSCKLIDYIDECDYIYRCKEVPSLTLDYAGIPGRLFNISVYCVRYSDLPVRGALEYAQPLKALCAMKNRNLLKESDLQFQRTIFCESLKEMLHDGRNSYKYCELIEFEDEQCELHKVLLQHLSR